MDYRVSYRSSVVIIERIYTMPNVSHRGEEMIHSPIRSLIPFAREAKDKGINVYHLNIGQPDIKTPDSALRALASYDQEIIGYGASEGLESLRETVKKYYCENVSQISLENLYVTTGASEAILFALFSCFDSGAEIIIPEPFYANYIGFSQISGVRLVPVKSKIEDGFALPDTADIESKVTDKTRAIFLCNPSNPTGNLYSKSELLAIAELVKKHDLFLLVDEVYREFCYDDSFYSVLNIIGLEDHVLVIDSISKVFSACGSRIGFVVSRNEELMSSILKYAQLRLCPPMIGQHIAEACFVDRTHYLKEVREEYNKRRLFLYDRLSKISGVKCYLPKAAFYIMTELPVADSDHFCKWLLSDFSFNNSTIMMAPGQGFYLTPKSGHKQVRIAFVLGVEALAKSMDILEEALTAYAKIEHPSIQLSTTL